jgi:DNA adenine methylase
MLLNTPVKPAMKWVGNKQGTPVIDRVAELYESFRASHIWHEPFVGIGGALLTINPDQAVCCDFSAEVIGLHRWIRLGGQMQQFDREWEESEYYQRRSRFQALQVEYKDSFGGVDQDEFFSLMLWLNRACFNGLWRVNKSGLFNAPVGRKSDGSLNRFGSAILPTYKKQWHFFEGGFEYEWVKDSHFTYVDPPYWETHSAYTAKGFSWDDQINLAKMLAEKRSPVVASNSGGKEMVELYQTLGFEIEMVPVRRSINCKGGDRAPAIEMLAYKNC